MLLGLLYVDLMRRCFLLLCVHSVYRVLFQHELITNFRDFLLFSVVCLSLFVLAIFALLLHFAICAFTLRDPVSSVLSVRII